MNQKSFAKKKSVYGKDKKEMVENAQIKVRGEKIRIKEGTVIYADKVCKKDKGGRNDYGV